MFCDLLSGPEETGVEVVGTCKKSPDLIKGEFAIVRGFERKCLKNIRVCSGRLIYPGPLIFVLAFDMKQ